MEEDPAPLSFSEAKEVALENLDAIRLSLVRCIDDGFLGPGDALYNKVLDLIDDAAIIKTWDEMDELVAQAKLFEQDLDTWLALHGRSSMALSWPIKPNC